MRADLGPREHPKVALTTPQCCAAKAPHNQKPSSVTCVEELVINLVVAIGMFILTVD